jgi:hypothetical protein
MLTARYPFAANNPADTASIRSLTDTWSAARRAGRPGLRRVLPPTCVNAAAELFRELFEPVFMPPSFVASRRTRCLARCRRLRRECIQTRLPEWIN